MLVAGADDGGAALPGRLRPSVLSLGVPLRWDRDGCLALNWAAGAAGAKESAPPNPGVDDCEPEFSSAMARGLLWLFGDPGCEYEGSGGVALATGGVDAELDLFRREL